MARKTQVSKEIILQEALEMLIRDGYSAINIKTLSKEIGCSTQPLVWHFENMAGLRKALAEYALNYANGKMRSCVQNGMDAFAGVGMAYINLAFDEPNLFQYLYMSGESELRAGGFDVLVHAEANAAMAAQIADDLKIPKENVSSFFSEYNDLYPWACMLYRFGSDNVFKRRSYQNGSSGCAYFFVTGRCKNESGGK